MRVTVSGASGTIGLASVRALIRAGHQVRAFVRDGARFRARLPDERVEVVEGAILDRGAVAEAMAEAGAVIYCVAFPPRDFGVAWDATRIALEALQPGGQFVLPGNAWVYGPPQAERVGPDHPKQSPARLGEVRADLERAVTAEGGTVVHLPEVYGAGVRTGWPYRVFQRALAGKSAWFPGQLDRQIEFLYIEDAARALVAPLGRQVARGSDYTAPSCAPTTPRRFANLVFKVAGRQPRLRSLPPAWLRGFDLLHPERRALRDLSYLFECSTLFDGTQIRRDLGWMPEVDYAEGVRRTIKWLRSPTNAAHTAASA